MNRTTRKIALRDRPWTNSWVAALCGPFDMPSPAVLAAAVTALNERYPHCRIAWGWDDGRQHWMTPTGSSAGEDVVTQGGYVERSDIAKTLDGIGADSSLRTPLALIRYENYLGLRMSHAMGDGNTFNEVFAAVLHTAITGDIYPWGLGSSDRFPLASATMRTFGRTPGLLRATIADKSRQVNAEPGHLLPWTPARRTLVAVLPAELKREIVHCARQSAPDASWLSILISTLMRGLGAADVPVAQSISIVFDIRRYLSNQSLDGNFVIGVPIDVDALSGPATISNLIRRTGRSGRPVATLASAALGWMRAKPDGVATYDPQLPVRVTFSAMGQPRQIDSLPFLTGQPGIYTGGVEPDGPHGLTFLVSETSGNSVISASFHENVVPAQAVQRALNALSHDAVEQLSRGRLES